MGHNRHDAQSAVKSDLFWLTIHDRTTSILLAQWVTAIDEWSTFMCLHLKLSVSLRCRQTITPSHPWWKYPL